MVGEEEEGWKDIWEERQCEEGWLEEIRRKKRNKRREKKRQRKKEGKKLK